MCGCVFLERRDGFLIHTWKLMGTSNPNDKSLDNLLRGLRGLLSAAVGFRFVVLALLS